MTTVSSEQARAAIPCVFQADEVSNAQAWNSLLLSFPSPHPMQTWQWGEAREGLGDKVQRWLVTAGTEPVLMAQVFFRRWRRLPVWLAWVPRGPVCSDYHVAEKAIRALSKPLKANGCRIVIVQPHSPVSTPRLLHRLPRQDEFTFVLDLHQDLSATERLLRNKGINRFQRESGVVNLRVEGDAIKALKENYAQLVDRKGFRPYGGDELITGVWNAFRKYESAQIKALLFSAEIGGNVSNTALVLRVGQSAHYLWAASGYQQRNLGSGEALQWEIIQYLRASGVRYYDLEGGDPKGNPGVFQFKKKLGGRLLKRSPVGFLIL